MVSQVTWAVVAWGINFAVLWTVVRLMALQNPPPGVEVFAYSGYVFFNFCISILCGWLLGRGFGWHAAWLYTSLCMSIFLIRTYKSYIRSSTSQPGIQGGASFDFTQHCASCLYIHHESGLQDVNWIRTGPAAVVGTHTSCY